MSDDDKTLKAARLMLVISFSATLACFAAMVWHGIAGNLFGVTASLFATIVCVAAAAMFSSVEDRLIAKQKPEPPA